MSPIKIIVVGWLLGNLVLAIKLGLNAWAKSHRPMHIADHFHPKRHHFDDTH